MIDTLDDAPQNKGEKVIYKNGILKRRSAGRILWKAKFLKYRITSK